MEQNLRKRRSLVLLLLSLAVIVAAVLVLDRFSARLDLSADGANTLSKASRELYKEIPEQLRITYYISSTLADRHPGPRAVEGLVRSLAAASRGKIAVDVADPASGKKEAAVEALGVAPQRMQIVEKNEQRVALVYSGLVIQYLGRTQVLPFVLSTDTLEYDLVKAIKAAIADKKPVASILIGDADKSLGERLQEPLRRAPEVGLGRQGAPPRRRRPPRDLRSSSSSATRAWTTTTPIGSTPTWPRVAGPSSRSRASTSRSGRGSGPASRTTPCSAPSSPTASGSTATWSSTSPRSRRPSRWPRPSGARRSATSSTRIGS